MARRSTSSDPEPDGTFTDTLRQVLAVELRRQRRVLLAGVLVTLVACVGLAAAIERFI